MYTPHRMTTNLDEGRIVFVPDKPPVKVPHKCQPPSLYGTEGGTIWQCGCNQYWRLHKSAGAVYWDRLTSLGCALRQSPFLRKHHPYANVHLGIAVFSAFATACAAIITEDPYVMFSLFGALAEAVFSVLADQAVPGTVPS